MKALLISSLILLLVGCRKEQEPFRPYAYDGEYPATMTGERIKTYVPEKRGGEINVFFNGHSWNHAPYLSLNAHEMDLSVTNNGEVQLSIDIATLLTNEPIDACIFETLHIQIPLARGRFTFTKELPLNGEISARFYSINCDAGKDNYVVNHSATSSWIDVKRYDTVSRALEAEFDLSFVIKERNYAFGPIYPTHVHMRGTIKTVAKVFK